MKYLGHPGCIIMYEKNCFLSSTPGGDYVEGHARCFKSRTFDQIIDLEPAIYIVDTSLKAPFKFHVDVDFIRPRTKILRAMGQTIRNEKNIVKGLSFSVEETRKAKGDVAANIYAKS